ncbi:uncharacterized protein KIAA2012 homolog [Salmo salar]|uniref:Uncharacterized protein KIAA2012 homolog n=2 Tax=Salmo salar TaxID=8030 RepID=A0ABM3E7N3_SALSA|nr:uncharacterized protein KIAA2012 homolog [Salmo salar]
MAGRLRGPGKQSSMAIYKDRSDVHIPGDPSDPGRAMVRGSLPLELRELQQQTGRSLGTLILGPDGEVIQMSPWDPNNMSATEDQPEDQVTRDHGEASNPERPQTNMDECELVQEVGSDGQTVVSGEQRQEPESPRNRTTRKQLHPDAQRPGGRHKDMMAALSYNLRSRTAPVEIPRQEEGKATREGKEVRREEAEEKSTTRKRRQDLDQTGPQTSGVSSLPTTEEEEEEETQNINPHKPSQPIPTGLSTERALSQKKNPNRSEGPLTPSGRKRGHSKKTNVTVDEQNPQQVEGQTQETGEQTIREKKKKDTLNKEVESQDSPTLQKMTKRKVIEGQEQNQEVFSKEAGKKKKARVKGKPKEKTNKTNESETSPSALGPGGDVKKDTEERSVVQSPRSNHSSVNRSSSSNGQSGQRSHRSTSCEDEVLPSGQRRSSRDQLSSSSVVVAAETQPLNLVMSDTSISTIGRFQSVTETGVGFDKLLAVWLRRLAEEEERQLLEEKETERRRKEQAEKEREWRKKEKKRRQFEMIQKIRQEEEERRAAELELQRLEEAMSKEEDRKRLAAMEDHEKREYLQKQKEEEEERKKVVEERKIREEEAAQWAKEEARLQAELFARQRAMLEQQLQFRRGLLTEAGALGQTQDISRAWVYSYFQLIQLLGLTEVPTAQEDSPEDMS